MAGEQARRRAEGRYKGVRAKPKRLNFTLRDKGWVCVCVWGACQVIREVRQADVCFRRILLAGRMDRAGTLGGWGPAGRPVQ